MKNWKMMRRMPALVLAVCLLAGCFSGCSILSAVRQAGQEASGAEEGLEEPKAEKGGFKWPFQFGSKEEEVQTMPATENWEEEIPAEEIPQTTEPVEEAPQITEPVEGTTSDFDTFPLQVLHPEYGQGEITASVLNVREYPGEDYEIVRGLERGSRVYIDGQTTVNGVPWGEIYDGWVCMDYVAMDGDVVGSWYQELDSDPATGEQRYGFWTFDLSGEFRFVIYRFAGEQVRQESRSGGEFRMDETRIALRFTYGAEDVTVGGITTAVPGDISLNWNVLGKTMTLQDAQRTTLTRGTVEKLKKQLASD